MAGVGPNRSEAEHNAFGRFILGPFHVLLSVLANVHDDCAEAEWLEWRSAASAWRVCTSRLLVLGGDTAAVDYQSFLERLRELFVSEVSPGLHWCDVFFASVDGTPTVDVRLDSEPWPKAGEALARWFAAPAQDFQSYRHFFVALPA